MLYEKMHVREVFTYAKADDFKDESVTKILAGVDRLVKGETNKEAPKKK
jgi:hypothetical protein